MQRKKRWMIWMLAAMLLMTGCSFRKVTDALPFGGVQGERSGELEEPLQGQERLWLQNVSGEIQLVPSKDNTLRVQYTQRIGLRESGAEVAQVLEELPLIVHKDGYSVEISPPSVDEKEEIKWQRVDMVLQVPEQLKRLKVAGTSGKIGISGFKEQEAVTLSLDSGSIRMEQCAAEDFSIEVKSGDIALDRVRGNGDVELLKGNADFSRIQGNVTYQSTSGKLVMEEIEGALDCELSSGTMDIRKARLNASSSFYTTAGTILLQAEELDADGHYAFKASAADVRLILPQDQGYELDIESVSGKVKAAPAFDGASVEKTSSSLKGRIRDGGAQIAVFVTSGNVRVE